MAMKAYSVTHMGLVRTNNEDRCAIKDLGDETILLILADGMGGHAAGELAAQIAVDMLSTFDPAGVDIEAQLVMLVVSSHAKVMEASRKEQSHRGMGTTLTAALLDDGIVYWVHVGDSRLYVMKGGELTQITDDHTIPGLLVKEGEITKEAMRTHHLRNMLLRCVGCEMFEPDWGCFDVEEGDLILLSTDGLHDAVAEEVVASILGSGKEDLEGKLNGLVRAALAAGGRDNITVLGVEL